MAYLCRMSTRGLGVVVAALALSSSLGCTLSNRSDPIVVGGRPPAGGRRAQAAPPPRAAAPAAAPAPDGPQADPEAQRQFLDGLSQPSAPLAVTMRPPEVTAIGLTNTARGEAGSSTPDAAMTAAALQEGQRATMPVTLAPGDCTTFIAQGGLGLVEVDLFLTVGSGASLRILAQDPTSGPIAVIGGKTGGCFRNPQAAPLAAEVAVRARRGAGLVIVRGYRK